MKKLIASFLLAFLLVLVVLPRLHAQTAASAPADNKPTATNPAPAGQAPDDVMKKLSDLVHAGKYAEAQQTVAALLILYPDDQRLVKAKALLDKASVTAGAPSGAPSANPPTSNVASPQPASNLSGMDKVDYNALIELGRQAQQTVDLEQQNAALKQFMTASGLFLQKHPNEMVLWQLRVVSAISLNDPMAGYDAGQKLLAAGAADSNDPNLQRLLGQIKNKGWLDKQIADKAEKLNHTISVIFTGDGQARSNTDGPVGINLRGRIEGNMIAELQSRFPHTNINIDTPDAGDPALRVTINLHDTDWDDSKCGLFSCDVYVNSQLLISISSPAGALVNRSFELHIKNSVSKGRSVVSAAKVAPLLPDWMGQEVLGKLRGVLDEDAVRTSMRQSPTP